MAGWTDEARDWAVTQYKLGMSCSLISSRLRTEFPDLEPKSRNAVIGVVNRAGCGRDHRSPQFISRTSTKRRRRERAAKQATNTKPPWGFAGAGPHDPDKVGKPNPEMTAAIAAMDAGAPVSSKRVPILVRDDRGQVVANPDLTDQSCRWPVNNAGEPFAFCGCERVPGVPYCEAHARRAFQPPAVRRSVSGVAPDPANSNTPASGQRRETEGVS